MLLIVSLVLEKLHNTLLTSTLRLYGTLQHIAYSEQAELMPELWRNILADLEVPSTTPRVSRIFPHRLDSHVE